jgi:hypothetical protein
MNRKYDYLTLEREYIAGDMSIRALARRHGIDNPSLVHVQARKGDWITKRAEYRRRAQHKTLERLADADARRAERELEVRDHAIEVIDQALTRLSEDMAATKVVEHEGRQTVEPVLHVSAKDMALLLDRLEPLFSRPALTDQGSHLETGLFATPVNAAEVEALWRIGELARARVRATRPRPTLDGLAGPTEQQPRALAATTSSGKQTDLD